MLPAITIAFPLVGDLCIVRNTVLSDATEMVSWRNASRNAFFDTRPVSLEQTIRFLEECEGYALTIVEKATEQPCGFTSFHNFGPGNRRVEWARTMIDPSMRGKGIIQEVCHLIFPYIFENTLVEKLWGSVRLDNFAVGVHYNVSVGMELEGLLCQHEFTPDGRLIDIVLVGCQKERYLNHFDWIARCYDEPNELAIMLEKHLGGKLCSSQP